MIGLSVWLYRNPDKLSKTDIVINNIIRHNAKFFKQYCIVTNNGVLVRSLGNDVEPIMVGDLNDWVKEHLSKEIDFDTIRDHQWSDIGTVFARELTNSKDEGVLYIDSDFLITNGVLIDEIERYETEDYLNFLDKNFYLLSDYPNYYINAAVSYTPAGTLRNRDIRYKLMDEMAIRLASGNASQYNDIGPRLLAKFSQGLSVPARVLPNDPDFGEICGIEDDRLLDYKVKYNKESLGVHLLLSMFKKCKLSVEHIEIKLDCVELKLKSIC